MTCPDLQCKHFVGDKVVSSSPQLHFDSDSDSLIVIAGSVQVHSATSMAGTSSDDEGPEENNATATGKPTENEHENEKHHMFIYGTLKEGQPNHKHFKGQYGKATKLGPAETINSWPLIIATRFNLPFLLHAKHHGKKVKGEVYAVNDDMLEWMDKFEGHPQVYNRNVINVRTEWPGQDAKILQCFTYFLPNVNDKLLSLPTFEWYEAFGDHDRHYNTGKESPDGPEGILRALEDP